MNIEYIETAMIESTARVSYATRSCVVDFVLSSLLLVDKPKSNDPGVVRPSQRTSNGSDHKIRVILAPCLCVLALVRITEWAISVHPSQMIEWGLQHAA